jgi:hypothetical protein
VRRSSYPAKFLILLLFFSLMFAANPIAARASVSIGISVNFGPPALPYYEQPPDPSPNYIWSPGYWAYGGGGYYWVPGTWVPAPQPGLYWTPGYWGWNNGYYYWNQGYWAPQVGFYGGVNYGYGYYGNGYVGGMWSGNQFRYNTAITNVNRGRVRNVFSNRAVAVSTWNRVSFNGGRGGINARPTQNQLAVQRGHRVAATSTQVQHQRLAAGNRANFATVNRGRPATGAVTHAFSSTNRPAGARSASAQARTAPVHAAQVHAAPVHAAQVRTAPRHAMAQHAATQHSAPRNVAHVTPQRAAPQRAAPQRASGPQRASAPQKGDPQHDKTPKQP